jgi:hypothetical protein
MKINKILFAVVFGLHLFCPVIYAVPFVIPTMVISGTSVFSGPSFTVSGNYGVNDIIYIEGTGTVDLNFGNYTANAAGVIVSPSTTNTGNHLGQTSPADFGALDPGAPYAALLIGNASLGFHPLFAANSSAGFGSSSVPSDIFAMETIGQVFGTAVNNGTVLELVVNDINNYDNSGSFTITTHPIPDEWSMRASFISSLGLLSSMLLFRKKQNS